MSKILLTMSTGYLPNWGLSEGVREILQNAKDAEIEHNAPMSVTLSNEVLRIENDGAILPLKALLLGQTSKLNKPGMIGQFGEGLKIGVMALLRAGHAVKIRNGSEVWAPSLVIDDRFGEEVISFDIQGGREMKNRVRVEIDGITKAMWAEMKQNFLFLDSKSTDDRIKTSNGSLLLDPKFRGKVFVKGIFVQNDPSMAYGYDMTRGVDLDRDRRMVESWNLKYYTQSILTSALAQRPDLFGSFADLLANPTTEVDSVDGTSWGIPDAAIDYVYARFVERHGADAVPVETLADSKDIEHLGKKGIVVSKQLGGVLSKKFGSLLLLREKLSQESLKEYSWDDITSEDQQNLLSAIELVNPVVPVGLSDIKIVDFRSENLEGQFSGGTVLIAKKHLSDRNKTLEILVHEVAHNVGADGDKSHVARIEHIWSKIVAKLRGS